MERPKRSSPREISEAAIPFQNDDVIPSKLILNNPTIKLNTNTVTTSSSDTESYDEYDYDYNYEYDPETENEIDYNDFSSLQWLIPPHIKSLISHPYILTNQKQAHRRSSMYDIPSC